MKITEARTIQMGFRRRTMQGLVMAQFSGMWKSKGCKLLILAIPKSLGLIF